MGNCSGCCEQHERAPSLNSPVSPNRAGELGAVRLDNPKKEKSRSRVSFSDLSNVGPLSVNIGDVTADEVAEKGVLNVNFGILRQSNLYGCFQALPDGATGADIVQPLPEGVTAEVRDNAGARSLWITLESNVPGRCQGTFKAKPIGSADPSELTINVYANVMSIDEGRPSSKREGVQLLQRRTPARFSILDPSSVPVNEGMMWVKGKALNQVEEVDN